MGGIASCHSFCLTTSKEGTLKLRACDEPGGMAGGVAFVVDEDEAAVDVLQLHQYHGAGAVVASAGN